MTLQMDQADVTLDGSGYYYHPYSVRWINLESVQYARTHCDAVANTGGALVQVYSLCTGYNEQGDPIIAMALPAGPWIGNTPELGMGGWALVPQQLVTAGDVSMQTVIYGTPNASVTVYWAELHFR
jgi:hypothetical protein